MAKFFARRNRPDRAIPYFYTVANRIKAKYGLPPSLTSDTLEIAHPWNRDTVDLSLLYNHWGDAHYQLGQFSHAIQCWKEGLTLRQIFARRLSLDRLRLRILPGYVWTARIGHIGLLDAYIKMGLLGLRDNKETILLADRERVSNSCFLDYFSPYISVVDTNSLSKETQEYHILLEEPYHVIEMGGKVMFITDAAAYTEVLWQKQHREPLLKLSDTDRERGELLLHRLGLPRESWYVCLHVRDDGCFKDARRSSARNGSIDSYERAIQEINRRGGWIIRVGDKSMTPYKGRGQLIEYNRSELKSDFMDVFLCASCRFFMGTNSGLFMVPSVFGVPAVLTNWYPIRARPWYANQLFVPKLLWNRQQKRFLSLSEMLQEPYSILESSERLRRLNMEVVGNQPDDILEVVKEMLDALDGKRKAFSSSLQEKFDALARSHHSLGMGRIGEHFLSKNPWFLQ